MVGEGEVVVPAQGANAAQEIIRKKAPWRHQAHLVDDNCLQMGDGHGVVLIDPKGKSYEFYMNKIKAKRNEILNTPSKLKGEKLVGTAIKKWEPPEESLPHVSGAVTINPRQHISGN